MKIEYMYLNRISEDLQKSQVDDEGYYVLNLYWSISDIKPKYHPRRLTVSDCTSLKLIKKSLHVNNDLVI